MTLLKAIATANKLRPNAIEDDLKAGWIYELEAEVSELMDVDMPENTFPEDQELLMPSPYDSMYALYIAANIDFAIEDSQLYINDMTMANAAKDNAFKWWRRHHKKKCNQYIRAASWQPKIKEEEEEDETTRTTNQDTELGVTDLPSVGD